MNEIESLKNKLDKILENQEVIKSMLYIGLLGIDQLVKHEKSPADFIQNLIANFIGDEVEWNKRGRYTK